MKIKKETQKRISYICGIIMAVFFLMISSIQLLMNINWMNGAFFMFGVMFCMGYVLLSVALRRIREVGANA